MNDACPAQCFRDESIHEWEVSEELAELVADSFRHSGSQPRMRFEQTRDVGQVLLMFAALLGIVLAGPDHAAQHIVHRGYRHRCSQDRVLSGAIKEGLIAAVQLNLDPQIRARGGQVKTVWIERNRTVGK